MGTLRFFEEVVSFKIRRTFGFADYICSDFVELINPIYSARRNAEKEIFNLSALRDTLLPKLMAGEIAIE